MKRNIKWVLAVLSAAALAVPFSGCSDDNNTTSNRSIVYYDSQNSYVETAPSYNSEVQEAMDNASKTEGQVGGEAVVVNDCSVVVKKVVSLGIRPADDLHAEDGEMLAAEIEVSNNTSEVVTVSALGNAEVSVDGGSAVIGMDLNTSLRASKEIEDYCDLSYEAEPGQTVSGYITFSAPVGWKEITIAYTPGTGENEYDSAVYKFTPEQVEK